MGGRETERKGEIEQERDSVRARGRNHFLMGDGGVLRKKGRRD